MLNRRGLLANFAAFLISMMLPRIASDDSNLLLAFDPMVRGVRWQSWPFGAERPSVDYAAGTITVDRPFSHYAAKMKERRKVYPDLDWEPML